MSDWRSEALCRPGSGIDPELFFPVGTGGPALMQIVEAKRVCSKCPVTLMCADFADRSGITEGVFGGLTEEERRTRRRVPA